MISLKSFAGCAVLLMTVLPLSADTVAQEVDYQGWKGALELNNGTVRLVVVPAVGRIMHYGFVDGPNVLWVDPKSAGKVNPTDGPALEDGKPTWVSYGGDRIWPTEEDRFEQVNGARRPPDYFIDGMPWSGKIENGEIVITSPISRFCGAQVTRRISLAADSPLVTIHQVLSKKQLGANGAVEPIPLTLWNVSTIRLPEQVFFPLNPQSRFENQVLVPIWPDVKNHGAENISRESGVAVFLPNKVDQKVGADAPGWLAGIVDDLVMVQFFRFDPKAEYPDGGTSVTAYLNPQIGELECLTPLVRLKPGESSEQVLWWNLGKVRPGSRAEHRGQALKWIQSVAPATP